MSVLARGAGQSGAESEVSGTIAIYATWMEDLYFYDPDGSAMDLTGIAFEFQFRSDPASTSADVTLSTATSTLSIEDDAGAVASILRIAAPAATFQSYPGDMVADLVGVDQDDNVTLYAHGIVSFTNNGVAV